MVGTKPTVLPSLFCCRTQPRMSWADTKTRQLLLLAAMRVEGWTGKRWGWLLGQTGMQAELLNCRCAELVCGVAVLGGCHHFSVVSVSFWWVGFSPSFFPGLFCGDWFISSCRPRPHCGSDRKALARLQQWLGFPVSHWLPRSHSLCSM